MPLTVCGLDEVGRGALAGPLLAAAIVIKCPAQKIITTAPAPIRDSKKLTKKQRLQLFKFIQSLPIQFAIESISVSEINKQGISWANKTVFTNLINQIQAQKYIVDGNLDFSTHPKTALIQSQTKADNFILEVMLASIVAKVARDNIMAKLHIDSPHYSWDQNVGYGTLSHRQAILKHGPSPHHRTLFIRNIMATQSL